MVESTEYIIKNALINTCKIGVIYFIIITLFYAIHSNLLRVILSILLYLISIVLFKINFVIGFLYFLMGIGAAFTEYIFIKYIKLSWDYRNPDFFSIPLWLIPLWGIAIILLIECSIIIKDITGLF
tara:strand:+ start:135 stop:512 length:378 start_codon:yes stop_codon:yes gene_type:complete